MNNQPHKQTTVVLLTYANRKSLLLSVLDNLISMNISRAIVVDNGASWPIIKELYELYGDSVDVLSMESNQGTAVGYAKGIRRAIELGAEYIWLLDDDNKPNDDALALLYSVYKKNEDTCKVDGSLLLACASYRREQYGVINTTRELFRIRPRRNSICNFHFLDIYSRITANLYISHKNISANDVIELSSAPYGGLFFHKNLIEFIGLPNSDYIIYTDDIEFTWRIYAHGGKILMPIAAEIHDLDKNWRSVGHKKKLLWSWLMQGSNFRAYYAMRNITYFDYYYRSSNKFIFKINLFLFKFLLLFCSIRYNSKERYKILISAMNDGLAGRLGLNNLFPLPKFVIKN